MNREPQVGDIYGYSRDLCRAIVGISSTGYCVWYRFIDDRPFGLIRGKHLGSKKNMVYSNGIKYMGKLAPWYKRLFGIYFVRDR